MATRAGDATSLTGGEAPDGAGAAPSTGPSQARSSGAARGPVPAGPVVPDPTTTDEARRGPRPRLVLMAEDRLVGDTVRVALASRGFEAIDLGWPPPHRSAEDHRRRVAPARARVGIIFGDLTSTRHRAEARAVVEAVPLRWLLVVKDPTDPVWGGMVEAGAAGVLPDSVGLDDVSLALTMLLAGEELLSPARRRRMVQDWSESRRTDAHLAALVARLTAREQEILALLYQGVTVAEIAQRTGVTEQTVRSQVKAVLRKLEVNSQLAAVAVYRRVLGGPR